MTTPSRFTPSSSDSLILRAARFATAAHEGQLRKYVNEPYIYHPARVAARVSLLSWATPVMVAAAYLHDTIEDTGVTFEELSQAFGEDVALLVNELTDQFPKGFIGNLGLPLNRAARKELEAQRLGNASFAAQAIKLADIADNLIGQDPHDKFAPVFLAEKQRLLFLIGSVDASLRGDVEAAAEKLQARIVG